MPAVSKGGDGRGRSGIVLCKVSTVRLGTYPDYQMEVFRRESLPICEGVQPRHEPPRLILTIGPLQLHTTAFSTCAVFRQDNGWLSLPRLLECMNAAGIG